MKFLRNARAPLPPALETVHDFVLQSDIRGQLEREHPDLERLCALLAEAARRGERLLDEEIKYLAADRMGKLMECIGAEPANTETVSFATQFAQRVIPPLQIGMNLWKVQNLYWRMLNHLKGNSSLNPQGRTDANGGDHLTVFLELGRTLGFAEDTLKPASQDPAQLAAAA